MTASTRILVLAFVPEESLASARQVLLQNGFLPVAHATIDTADNSHLSSGVSCCLNSNLTLTPSYVISWDLVSRVHGVGSRLVHGESNVEQNMHVGNVCDKKIEERLGCTFTTVFLPSVFEKFSQAVAL